MNTTIEEISPSRKNLIITLSGEDIANTRKGIISEVSKSVQIPGFRPGRAPADLVAKKYRRQINDEIHRKLVGGRLQDAIKTEKLSVLSVIDIKAPDSFEDGQEQSITYTVDLNPEFEIPPFDDIALERQDTSVTDEEVNAQIEEIRTQRADFKEVERPTESGDYVKVSYTGKIDGQAIAQIVPDQPIYGEQKSTWEEAGNSEFGIPGLPEALVGLAPGDKKEVEVSFPSDFKAEKLAGQKAIYEVEVLEVRERQLPEINEEFLKGLQVETEQDLRDRVRADLENRKRQESHFKARQTFADALAAKVEFPLPETAVESRTEQYLRRLVEQNTQQGVPREKLEEKKDELFASARQTAVNRVKLEYLVFAIAEKEKIEITEQDMQQVLMNEAMRSGKKPQDLVKEWQKDQDQLRHIQREVLFDKALDTLVERQLSKDENTEPQTAEPQKS